MYVHAVFPSNLFCQFNTLYHLHAVGRKFISTQYLWCYWLWKTTTEILHDFTEFKCRFFRAFFPPFQQRRLKERGKWLLHLSQMSTYKCYMFRYFSDPMTQNLIPSWIHIITLYIVVLSSRLFTTKGVW